MNEHDEHLISSYSYPGDEENLEEGGSPIGPPSLLEPLGDPAWEFQHHLIQWEFRHIEETGYRHERDWEIDVPFWSRANYKKRSRKVDGA